MMQLIKKLLLKIINDIDAGNSNLNEKLSKYQACKYLNVSRATFDNYVRDKKIPKGRKQQGFKELFWYKKRFRYKLVLLCLL